MRRIDLKICIRTLESNSWTLSRRYPLAITDTWAAFEALIVSQEVNDIIGGITSD